MGRPWTFLLRRVRPKRHDRRHRLGSTGGALRCGPRQTYVLQALRQLQLLGRPRATMRASSIQMRTWRAWLSLRKAATSDCTATLQRRCGIFSEGDTRRRKGACTTLAQPLHHATCGAERRRRMPSLTATRWQGIRRGRSCPLLQTWWAKSRCKRRQRLRMVGGTPREPAWKRAR
jgi:hypothetical protein